MKQREIDQAVATATGESLQEIKRLGFNLVADENDFDFDPEPNILPFRVLDWDIVQEERQRWAA